MSQRAFVLEKIGQPVVIIERPIPEPKENEVLVKVAVAGINPHDGYSKAMGLLRGENTSYSVRSRYCWRPNSRLATSSSDSEIHRTQTNWVHKSTAVWTLTRRQRNRAMSA